jgi:hypothetical protein
MYAKVIVVTVLATLLVVAAMFALAFVAMPQFSATWQAFALTRPTQGYGRGYGPGMMGRDMMRGGMMGGPGYWNMPVAPNNPSDGPAAPTTPAAPPSSSDVAPTSTPAPSNPPTTSRGRGGMMGGQTPGGLVAVSPDGKALPVDSTNRLPDNTAAQKVGNLNISLALAPYPPTGFSKSDFDVTLTDDKGQPVTDAKVSLDLAMPAMWMPTNTPTAQNIGNGRYHATGLFTMRGLWRIQVIVDRGGAKQSAFFDVWL